MHVHTTVCVILNGSEYMELNIRDNYIVLCKIIFIRRISYFSFAVFLKFFTV